MKRSKIIFHVVALAMVCLAFLLSGCTLWHSMVAKPYAPPKYVVYPAPGLWSRLNDTNWMKANSFWMTNVAEWDKDYTNALAEVFPWLPDSNLLRQTFTNVFDEYGIDTDDIDNVASYQSNYLSLVTNAAYTDLYSANGYFRDYSLNDTNCLDGTNYLNYEVGVMLGLADKENYGLLVTNTDRKPAPISHKKHWCCWWHHSLPLMTSPNLPVGVALVSSWDENPPDEGTDNSASTPADSSQQKVTFDKLLVTLEAASSSTNSASASTNEKSPTAESPSVPDFDPDQQVTLSLSTVLNSASTLDRIDYVSTYVYIYPWPMSLDGSVVLEREFWRNFFELNAPQDPLVQTNLTLIDSDIQQAMDELRVRVQDISTTVSNVMVDIGTEQQTFGSQNQIGLSGTVPIGSVVSVTPQWNHTGSESTTETTALEQELDQRSTYIDSAGDFFRITQRGMKSVDLAGRFKDIATLHVPTTAEPIPVLVINTNTADTNGIFDVQYVSEPLYSEVDGITFSVVVAHEATKLAPTTDDTYNLEDQNDAAFIVGVTDPQRVTLWKWEKNLDRLSTWDIGITDKPAKRLRAIFPGGTDSAALYLAPFDTSQALIRERFESLLHEIYAAYNTNGHPIYVRCDSNDEWCVTNTAGSLKMGTVQAAKSSYERKKSKIQIGLGAQLKMKVFYRP